jgi:small-conductance mechanosensitive channel
MAYALIMFSAVFILSYQKELGIASPETVVWIYAFVMSLLTGFLGYAARGSLDDFFSGVMLRVNPPFGEGDRIVLPSGEICDVTKMGMTMVTLYNVTLNAEIYIPNKEIADMTITNISRPDLELRIQLSVPVRPGRGFLEQAEEILIDCAYAEGEVDQALVTRADLSEKGKEYWDNHDRITIEEQIRTLIHDYPDLENMPVPVGDNVKLDTKTFKAVVEEAQKSIADARANWVAHVSVGNDENNEKLNQKARTDGIRKIITSFGQLSGAIFSIADYRPELKEAIAPLVSEISKEPVVHSRVEASEEKSHVLVTLNAFALHLERRYEVENKLNKVILDRLAEANLLYGGIKNNRTVERR